MSQTAGSAGDASTPGSASDSALVGYFVLVFLVAWGAVIGVVGPSALLKGTSAQADWQLLPVFAAMLLGPPVVGAGLLWTGRGWRGIEDLWRRQRKWSVMPRWYAVALLTTPVLIFLILGPLSIGSWAFIPSVITGDDRANIVAFGVVVGVLSGVFEEVGWTGFALPELRRRCGPLLAGLILGIVWGLWHVLPDYWAASPDFGELWLPRIGLWIAALTAYRMLMSWVYEHTGSLLLSQLMHASFTGSQAILVPTLAPTDHFVWYGPFTAALWAMVVGLALGARGGRARH